MDFFKESQLLLRRLHPIRLSPPSFIKDSISGSQGSKTITDTPNVTKREKQSHLPSITTTGLFLGLSGKTWGAIGWIFLGIVVIGCILYLRYRIRKENQMQILNVPFEKSFD